MASDNEKPVAVVVGVGAGLGAAVARRFATVYRCPDGAQRGLSGETRDRDCRGRRALKPIPANVADAAELEVAFTRIRTELGAPTVLIYNAAMRPFGSLMETKPSTFEMTWRVSTLGAYICAQQVVPAMLEAGGGAIIFTGATAGIKPFATSAAFGPAKFALRGLAQLMARDLGPGGIHVA
jgi:NAD(P)-dependent dehydrogenase (short-subunit alcohol dehydrogenase family)